MTIRLYDQNVDILEFDAVVTGCCAKKNGQYAITLDRTAFFPEGGGQGADRGMIAGAQVLDAHEAGGEVEHTTDRPLEPGQTVLCRVDGARRLAMMQQHSGEHIFSGLVHKLYGYDNVGFHIGTEAVTMDFNGPLSSGDIERVERLANEAVWANLPVHAWIPEKAQLSEMTYRSKKAIEGDVRIVQIEGVDTCACCGTHVHQTGSIGQIKVMGWQKYKSGVRVSILCGVRALDEENIQQDQLRRAGTALSANQHEIAEAVQKLLAERDALRMENEMLGMRIFEMMMRAEREKAIRIVVCDALSSSQLRKAAGRLCAGARMGLVLHTKGEGWSFALSSETEDVRPVTRALCAAFEGRGGGPADMTQGVLGKGTAEEIRAKLMTI